MKTVSAASAVPGDTLTYLIFFNNTGKGLAKSVSIEDTLPAAVTFVSSSTAPTTVSGFGRTQLERLRRTLKQ